ncbi:DNA polymerase III subunit gamma/tau [Clostridiaceae bacterium HSG29]|nr:DNA polymerase III subunit gamma/tau [Clostridiaceae bacterium HSG29]
MSHLALYRKFRPLVFDDVVGQDNVVNTIKNQVLNNSFGHAYLFSGIRGTGKTTIAKIFARSINCLNKEDANPCNECNICKSIINGSSIDIIEMDAASNNGVDDIREINENVMFAPSNAKYKVYIIDEVHMLSKGAFNALLKTLEEPPEYVVFLLATTEPNKIPDTILSRCQRYDLKRVSSNDIFKRLVKILNELNTEYDDEALNLIVSKSEGSVRDSLSILDQCLSYEKLLSYDLVVDILGIIEIEILNNLVKTIIDENVNGAIELVNESFNKGKDIKQFVESVLNYFRNLLIVKMHSDATKLVNSSDSQYAFYKEYSEKIEITEILRILNIFIELEKNVKWSAHSKILFEMAIVKIFNNEYDFSIETLIQKIKKLEDKINLLELGKIVIKEKEIEAPISQAVKYETSESIEKFIEEGSKLDINIDEILSKWNEVLKIIKKARIKVYAFLMESEPIEVYGNKIVLKFDSEYKFHGDNLMKVQNRITVEEVLEKVFSKKLTIDVTYDNVLKESKNNKPENVEEEISNYFSGYGNVMNMEE